MQGLVIVLRFQPMLSRPAGTSNKIMVSMEPAGVELDGLSKNRLILKNASKSEARESLEPLKILVRPPRLPSVEAP
jgi:hypothetical protein